MQNLDWDRRFREQAGWTQSARQYLFSQIKLDPGARVLEVGCGTGAVLPDLTSDIAVHGLDINFEYLTIAQKGTQSPHLACGDAAHLPYANSIFSAVYCHFFLMWVDAAAALAEMLRVAKPGGWLLALAEPDYGGRIDYPDELSEIGRLQADSLWRQGAQPEMGRRLAGFFHQAGVQDVRTGVIGAEWTGKQGQFDRQSEWQVIRSDLNNIVDENELIRLQQLDEDAWNMGERVLFVPTFYACGRKG